MFPFSTLPVDTVPFDAIPFDIVPSTLQAVLMPLCEGIVAGLLLGVAVLFAISTIERLLVWWIGTQATDAQAAETSSIDGQPADVRQPAPRNVKGTRPLPTRPRRPIHQTPAPQRSVLVPTLT